MATSRCECTAPRHDLRFVVLTGGPGAGKTAVLETIRHNFCKHVIVLPESASIIFGGGFPRKTTASGVRSAQRAIFRVQRELERMAEDERTGAVVLCDRGTLDGLAYWPDDEGSFFTENETTREAEMRRYSMIIHLRTPAAGNGYDHRNPLRIESATEAAAIDERILRVWEGHPRRAMVANELDFLDKVVRAIALVREELPSCCRSVK